MWPIKQIRQWWQGRRKPDILRLLGIKSGPVVFYIVLEEPNSVDIIVRGRARRAVLDYRGGADALVLGQGAPIFLLSDATIKAMVTGNGRLAAGGPSCIKLTGEFDSDKPMQAESKP